jgi:RHS repeat-associated protein
MKVVGSETIRYVMGLAEHSTATGWRALYVYLGSEKLVEYRYANATRFFHNDHLGTTKAVTDHTGAVLERWDHYPFGEEWVSGLAGDRYRYTGHLRDQETGNDYAGARYYANTRGRWLSVDPVLGDVSNPQRLNRYSYVGNDPVNIVDPDGREWAYVNCEVVTVSALGRKTRQPTCDLVYFGGRAGPGGAGGSSGRGGEPGGRGGGILPIVPEQDYSGLIGSAVGRSLLRLEDEDCGRALGGEAAVAKLTEMWEGGRIRTPRNRQEWLAVQGAVAVYTNGKILINRDGGFKYRKALPGRTRGERLGPRHR